MPRPVQAFGFSRSVSRAGWTHRALSLSLTLLMASGSLNVLSAYAADDLLTGDVRVTVHPSQLQEVLPIPGARRKVTMSFHEVAVQDALRALAKEGGFNVLIDDTVTGATASGTSGATGSGLAGAAAAPAGSATTAPAPLSLDLNNVTIQDALESIRTAAGLAYRVDGRNLVVTAAGSPRAQAFNQATTRIFPLRYANARMMANFLNNTVFANPNAGGATGSATTPTQKVLTDNQTNSLIVVGTPTDLRTVQEHLEALDRPRLNKTWRLSHANALDVATILSASLFNEGQPIINTASGGGSTSASTPGAPPGQPGSLRVTTENIAEGSGGSAPSQSGSSSGGSGNAALVNNVTLRARTQATQTVQISPNGPIVLPDTRLNTITLLGTAEQIAMAEALIPTLDRKIPQVVLEASLIEISEDGRKELGYSTASNFRGVAGGTNSNTAGTALVNRPFSNPIGAPTSINTPLESLFRVTSRPLHSASGFLYQINALVNKNKAKVLANPTVITSSDNESIISIVDEIIRSVTVTTGTNGAPPTLSTNLGEAGIVLNLLPKVGANNTISLRVRPVVSSVFRIETDRLGNLITLLSKREALVQNVQLRDGETFVLGGLIHNTNRDAVTKDPTLSRLPIVGALARNSTAAKHRSELVILITPHILNDQSEVARSNPQVPTSALIPATLANKNAPATAGGTAEQGGIIPVANTTRERTNALPPLEQVHVIDGATGATPSAAPERPLRPRMPVGSLLLEEMLPAPTNSLIPAKAIPEKAQATAPPQRIQLSSPTTALTPPEPQEEMVNTQAVREEATDLPSARQPVLKTQKQAMPAQARPETSPEALIRAMMQRYAGR